MSTFAVSLSQFTNKVGISLDTVVRRAVFEIFIRVVMKTPVDTGYARSNWQVGVNQVPKGTVGERPITPGGKVKINPLNVFGKLDTKSIKAGGVVFIANNVEYIEALEDGHSKQAPSGMVKITMIEVTGQFERLVGWN